MTEPDAWAIAAAVRAGELTAEAALDQALQRIAADDGGINAFTVVLAEQARSAARAVDADRAAGRPLGLLAGVPVSVKDHIWLAGAPATNGSRALADFVPDESCVCVERLQAAGAVVVGKTNNPEFCYRGITDNDVYGLTRNPRDPTRTPGGSSGGAGASVAAGMVPLAIGTDGGGSIRIPAAFCGVYGLKPSFGLIPKLPGFRGWPTLSVNGPLAASARDLALALQVMAGPSERDWLAVPAAPVDYRAAVTGDLSPTGLRIAVSEDLGLAAVDPDVLAAFRQTVDTLADAGWSLDQAHPTPQDPSALWDPVALTEGYSSEGPLLAEWGDRMTDGTAELVRAGATIGGGRYVDTQHERAAYTRRWEEFFQRYDLILTPAMPVTAFEVGRLAPATIAGQPQEPSFDGWCALALPANLTGAPAASVPIGPGDGGLPVGMQIMGPRYADARVLRAAAAWQQLADAPPGS